MIPLIKTNIPPREILMPELEKVLYSGYVAQGEKVEEFERAFEAFVGEGYSLSLNSGTAALHISLILAGVKSGDEVISTPLTAEPTNVAIKMVGAKIRYADIDYNTGNIDPASIETKINSKTKAILVVDYAGTPVSVTKLQEISKKYKIPVVEDAAHAFGVKINGNSLLNYGDLSILSFHATKVFNTIEGGAIISPDEKTKKRIDYLKNFGFADETTVIAPGINAKMNELQAAYGLLQLKYVDHYIAKRKIIAETYREQLAGIPGIRFLNDMQGISHSYPYFTILIDEKEFRHSRDEVYEELKKYNIYARRYFYPLISQFPSYRGLVSAKPENLPVAEKVTRQVLCLPIFPDLELSTLDKIVSLILTK